MNWLRKKRSAEEMAILLATLYEGAFSADKFHSFVESDALSATQTMDMALAEWHAFGTFVFVRSLLVALNPDKVRHMPGLFRIAVAHKLVFNDAIRNFLSTDGLAREREYMEEFERIQDGRSTSRFFGRVVARITGHLSAEVEAEGLPQMADLATLVGLSKYVTSTMKTTIEALRNGILEK